MGRFSLARIVAPWPFILAAWLPQAGLAEPKR